MFELKNPTAFRRQGHAHLFALEWLEEAHRPTVQGNLPVKCAGHVRDIAALDEVFGGEAGVVVVPFGDRENDGAVALGIEALRARELFGCGAGARGTEGKAGLAAKFIDTHGANGNGADDEKEQRGQTAAGRPRRVGQAFGWRGWGLGTRG